MFLCVRDSNPVPQNHCFLCDSRHVRCESTARDFYCSVLRKPPASTLSPQKLNDSSPGSTAAATRGQQATAVGEVTESWNHYHQDDDAGDESQLTCCLWWMSTDRNCANTPDWVKHTAVNFGFLVLCNKLLLWSRPSWRGLTSEGREDNLSNAMNPKHLTQITGGGGKKKMKSQDAVWFLKSNMFTFCKCFLASRHFIA